MKFSRTVGNVQFAVRYTEKQAESRVDSLRKNGTEAKALKVSGEQNTFYWVVAVNYTECTDGEVIYVKECA
jgi:high-affinity K+ transport system ATPase subunit B